MRILLFLSILMAHQPVMDMAPRWSGGYGLQIRNEIISTSKTINWFEGVYTWSREKRFTFKIPVESGNTLMQPILALPLKKYQNHPGYTENWGITPQVKLPLGGEGSAGLSLSYSSEDPIFYQMYDFFGWKGFDGKTSIGFDGNLGWHPYHKNETNSGFFLMGDVSWRKSGNTSTIHSGPVLVGYRKNIMARVELKMPITGTEKAQPILNSGIGFVF